MTAPCQPLPKSVAEDMLQVVARALCDRTGDDQQQRYSRTRQMVMTTLGLAPRDGLEFMLATLAFGHFQMIMDSMSDVFHGLPDALKAKTKSAIVPLGRAMLETLRELRQVQLRPALGAAEAVRPEAAAAAQSEENVAPAPPEADPAPLSEAELATLTDPRLGLPDEVVAWLAGTGPAPPERASPERADAWSPEPGDRPAAAWRPVNVFAERQPAAAGSESAELPAWEDPSKSVEEHIVSYHETLAAIYETLAQGRAEIAANAKVALTD